MLDFSRPGKPTDYSYIEALNAQYRQECLNEHWFVLMEDARERMEAWRIDYNEVDRMFPSGIMRNQNPPD